MAFGVGHLCRVYSSQRTHHISFESRTMNRTTRPTCIVNTLATLAAVALGIIGATASHAAPSSNNGRGASDARIERVQPRPTDAAPSRSGTQRTQDRTQTRVYGALNPVQRVQANTVRRVNGATGR